MSRRTVRSPVPRVSAPVVYWLGFLWALALLAAAAVLAQDALAATDVLGSSWLDTWVDRLGEVRPGRWSVVVAVPLGLLGILLLFLALRPRRRTADPLRAEHDVFLRRGAAARIAADAAEHADGVLRARARGRKGRITVQAETLYEGDSGVEAEIRRVVGERLGPLDRTPRVRVRTRRGGA